MTGDQHPTAERDTFRHVLGHLPTGVSVIATLDEDRHPAGLTVGAFFSVSLEPPLVGFCVTLESNTWPVVQVAKRFAVSILAAEQLDVCRVLATKDPNKFDALAWTPAPTTGAPLIDGAVAHIDCELADQHRAGDHWLVTGRVLALSANDDSPDPLVFLKGDFGSVAKLARAK